MIENFERIKQNIARHKFANYAAKLDVLKQAIWRGLAQYIAKRQRSEIHMTLSGGVDSSLLLCMLAAQEMCPHLVAHTIAPSSDYPDLIYARMMKSRLPDVEYKEHLIETREVDAYELLMECLSGETKEIVSGDVIDELAGGYYAHQNAPDKLLALGDNLDVLVARHLEPLDAISTKHEITIFAAYATAEVFAAMSLFAVDELVTDYCRKKPIYDLACENLVPEPILGRKKMGLCSIALGAESSNSGGYQCGEPINLPV